MRTRAIYVRSFFAPASGDPAPNAPLPTFGVSVAFVEKVVHRYRTTGDIALKPYVGRSCEQVSLPRRACGSACPRCAACCIAWACRVKKVAPRVGARHGTCLGGTCGPPPAHRGARSPVPEVRGRIGCPSGADPAVWPRPPKRSGSWAACPRTTGRMSP
jgi:hypothetical protein